MSATPEGGKEGDGHAAECRKPFPAFYVRQVKAKRIESGRVVDLTAEGARLVAEQPLPVGTRIYIGIFLAKGEAPLVARATVTGDDGVALAIQFPQGGSAQSDSITRLSDHLRARRTGGRRAVG